MAVGVGDGVCAGVLVDVAALVLDGVCVGDCVGVADGTCVCVTDGLVDVVGSSEASGVVKSCSGRTAALPEGIGVAVVVSGVSEGFSPALPPQEKKNKLIHKITNTNKIICFILNLII